MLSKWWKTTTKVYVIFWGARFILQKHSPELQEGPSILACPLAPFFPENLVYQSAHLCHLDPTVENPRLSSDTWEVCIISFEAYRRATWSLWTVLACTALNRKIRCCASWSWLSNLLFIPAFLVHQLDQGHLLGQEDPEEKKIDWKPCGFIKAYWQ